MNPTNNHATTYHPAALIATDRRQALHEQRELPMHSSGAVLCADIVGFTSRLEQVEAQFGAKKGADVMTEQVNRLFTVLIEEVQRFAGVVVSFGGDSLTCWFAQAGQEDAALRAVCCGLAMQQTMQGFKNVKLPPLEPISFALKVSIAAGMATRLVVGNPDIQQLELLAGQVIARLAPIQQAASADRVLLDGESAKRLADRLTIAQWLEREGVAIGDIRGIKGAVQSQPVLSPLIPLLLPESLTKPWLLQPLYHRLSSGQGRFASELRSVVFLFLKFSRLDVSATGESFDPQGLDRLDGYLCSLQQILHEHGGYLLKVTIDDKGNYLLASFGAPLSHEEDLVNRALHVALLLRKTSQAVNWIEQVQIAISQASVLAGIFGSPQRAAFDLLGSEVNLLNRVVTHHAKAGQVVVTKIIQTQAHHQYHFGPAQQVEARGITGFVTIFELLAESTIDQAITLNRLTRQLARPLVGRQRERQKIEDLWQQAHLQQGQILLIEGAAGLGKSHLVADVLQELTQQHSQTLYAACERSSQYTPYHLWRLLLPQLFAQFDEPAGGHSDPAQRQEAIFAAVQQWIKQATQQQPLLLVLDDLHWIDEASRKLTVTLSRQLADWPILLILLQRPTLPERPENADQPPESPAALSPFPELSHLPNYHPLTLQEFSPDAVDALLTLRLAAKPSPLLLSFLLRLTQGNPFFIDELLLTLQNVGVLQQEVAKNHWTLALPTFQRLQAANCLQRDPQSGDWLIAPDAPLTAVEIGLPNTIERVIRLRIDALPEAARLTLKIASVIGRTFSHLLLAHIDPAFVDPTTLTQQLLTLVEAHLIVADANALDHPLNNPLDNPLGNLQANNYTFRHHLTQEITYQTLMERERRLAHQAVGEALEQLDPSAIEALAEHYWQVDRGAKALIYLEQAAQRAQRSAANQAALNYYNRLLELEPKHIPSLKGKVEVLHVLGLYDEEENTLNVLSAYNIVHNELTDIEMYYLWGTYFLVKEEYERASAMFQTVCTLAQQSDNSIALARAFTQLGWIARTQNQISDSQTYYEKALALFERSSLTSEAHFYAHIDTLNGLGTLFRQKRRYPEAEALYIKALELSQTHHHHREEARALNNIGIVALYQRELDRAKECCTQALLIRRSIGDLFGEGACLSNITAICSELGEYEEAIHMNIVAEKIHQSIRNSEGQINSAISLGIIYWQLGCLTEAKQTLEKGLKLAETAHDQIGRDYVRSNLGIVLRDMGDLDAAQDILAIGLASVQSYNDFIQEAVMNSYLATVFLEKKNFTLAEKHARNAMKIRETSELFAYMIDDRATLASIYLQMNQNLSALEQAKIIYHSLTDNNALKVEFPQRAWFICYQVFGATQQEEMARVAITRAIQIITQHANKLRDPLLRNTYLTKITLHRLINQAKQNDKMVDSD